ncbi:MAG: DsbA family protein [Candidatus Eisenbacteria bacterium]|nr:DsbA family protein [Candidatus Eisenbacteria bacterium]
MCKNRWIIAAAVLWAALAGATSAADVPWHLIEGGEDLRPFQQEVVAEVLAVAENYGGCDGTILDCLNRNPDDRAARRLADFVVRRVRADRDPEEILQEVEERRLSAAPPDIHEPDLDGLVPSGDADAPVQVVIYADFGCPYCKVATAAFREWTAEEPDKIAFYFKNFPLKTNEQAVPAALALLAAERQGRFWEALDYLYAKDDALGEATYAACAVETKMDAARFAADRKDKALVERLRNEKTEALHFGVRTTPGIFINGKRYLGVKTPEELYDRIDEELEMVAAEAEKK